VATQAERLPAAGSDEQPASPVVGVFRQGKKGYGTGNPMTQRVYSGWRGVTDPSHSLICVSYEPIQGSLACRFKTGVYVFEGVPENKYQILLKSPFAGSYFHKQIKDKYPCYNPQGILIPAKLDDSAVKAKQAKQAKKRLEAVPELTMNLFGEVERGSRAKKQG
jgi:hypothetical protein